MSGCVVTVYGESSSSSNECGNILRDCGKWRKTFCIIEEHSVRPELAMEQA